MIKFKTGTVKIGSSDELFKVEDIELRPSCKLDIETLIPQKYHKGELELKLEKYIFVNKTVQ